MASKTVATRVFDFVKISDALPTSLRAQLNGLRSQYSATQTKLTALSAEPETIDWAKYNTSVTSPDFVNDMKDSYTLASKVEYPADQYGALIASAEKSALAEATKLVEASKVKVAELEARLAAMKAEKPLDEITVDEFLATKPELASKIDEEIKNHNYT
eukprot:m.411312 g.411312  ORF g.411312 m.411312 type:complete len:159 (-) comp28626_c0_seq1:166-642(-)